ncbi:unnamed protein product [Lactuca saligna]|uniref:Uncharacterized protein n=1 Tax=Lactuca saligna TaxID=75948 RepID=A0AA36ELP7_LACSI|nr:unnamed protein product [Lactuca saligna]
MPDLQNFDFVGSISEVMLAKFLMENDLIMTYHSLPTFGIRPILAELQQENLLTTHRATIEMLTTTNVKFIGESSKAIHDSENRISEATRQFENPHHEDEKEAVSKLRANIKLNNVDLNSSITAQIDKLQKDLAIENKIMDELVEKTQKTKVLTKKLKNATQDITQLEEERSLVKGCISEINQYLMRIAETRDSSFTLSIQQNLSEKLQPVLAMLNQIQSVLVSRDSTKQGGDEEEKRKTETDRKDNRASGSGKDKGKGNFKDDNEENTMISESERISIEK